MFQGQYEYTIDDKGRLSIPAKFRDVIRGLGEERVVVTRYFEKCLVAYAPNAWRALREEIGAATMLKRETRLIQRFLVGAAVELSFDKQGRILIPLSLRKYASLEHDMVLIGLNDRFEIWGRESWEEEQSYAIDNISEAAQALVELDLKL